ncbi:hypothetical protein GMOD_00001104 [Pyrenophora seminiperda CCB06]|uniref:Uncharacterized protein n=1 Tax=Pyrenophora seminiperda CCB06 TaxID=1302712 RepID=A0A3M7LYF3_9PLEO|nr:hypothetical protein GMOD_00001104 [Pyrenophora seminiperda CCB06]
MAHELTGTTMAAISGVAGPAGPDMAYIAELYEEISRHPPGISARKLLIEHYMSLGDMWLQGALDEAKKLKSLVPTDPDGDEYLKVLVRTSSSAPDEKKSPGQIIRAGGNPNATSLKAAACEGVRAKAKLLISRFLRLQKFKKKDDESHQKSHIKTQAVKEADKKPVSNAIRVTQRACSLAQRIHENPKDGTQIAIEYLEDIVTWERHGVGSSINPDTIRDALVSWLNEVKLMLPQELFVHCEIAFMHVEHENLERNYVNDETMLGDKVKDIPRTDFYVTEDNYAWSMDELVQALKANSGVFRNPLSRDMFTPKDVEGILMHPVGCSLAALRVEQTELFIGVRVETMEKMENLAAVLLADQSSDTMASRTAVDEFLLYVATLPNLEQKSIEDLKCPAKDSHTGQPYDWSIGEAVRDAKSNRVCFHKTGDFIKQASKYLRKGREVTGRGR